MDSKKRLAIALAITCLIVVAIFASFGRSLFFVQIPSITLADVDGAESSSSGGSGGQEGDQYWQVAVTPETVQSVVATLSRPDSYYRELTVETLWSGGSYSSTVQYWEDSGWSHIRQTLASGAVRHDLVGAETAYYWYEGSSTWNSFPADERSADLSQHIPTYEEVLELEPERIVEAGFGERDGMSCIYVETDIDELGYLERYWISTDNGLLVGAETEKEGQIVLSMTSTEADVLQQEGNFTLPDGTVLYEPDSG